MVNNELKNKFIELLKSTKRDGIEELISYIETTDFYTAPASTRFHGSKEGGLLEHSLTVYEIFDKKIKEAGIDFPDDSIKISALLHDLCKVNFYKVDFRNTKNSLGEWVKVPYYTINDSLPLGHGEKSVMMIRDYIKLSREEMFSIRWHMGFTEPKESYNYVGETFNNYPMALLLHEADLEATYLAKI